MSSSSRYAPSMSIQTDSVKESIDLSVIPSNVPSLCIPRVFANITRERVEAVFDKLNIGRVARVDMIERSNDKGETWKRVFVHLEWNDSENARRCRERLLCANDVKVIYDEPWFWKVSANRSTKNPDSQRQDHGRREDYRQQDHRKDYRQQDSRRRQEPRPRQEPRQQDKQPSQREPSFEHRTPDGSPPRSHVEV